VCGARAFGTIQPWLSPAPEKGRVHHGELLVQVAWNPFIPDAAAEVLRLVQSGSALCDCSCFLLRSMYVQYKGDVPFEVFPQAAPVAENLRFVNRPSPSFGAAPSPAVAPATAATAAATSNGTRRQHLV